MAEDLGERSEEATPKRRLEAREEGNVARSQDLAGGLLLLAATVILWAAVWPMLGRFKTVLEAVLDGDTLGNPVDPAQAMTVVEYVAAAGVRIGLPLLLITGAVAFLTHFSQVGWLFAPKAVMPKLSKLNPMNGLKRIFGISGLVKVSLDTLKVALVITVAVVTMMQYREQIVVLPYLSVMQCLAESAKMMLDLALRLIAILLILGVFDLLFQRWKHKQDLKMTKHQVKDELKQTEGDPETKRRRMRMQQQIAMQRVASAVPKADVVVTNPEHVSVAIQYDAQRMNAPTVIAKGADYLALRIRQIALLRGIPVVQRPPLARALYRQVDVGQEVPPDFYKVVAEILAFVYQLNNRMAG
ncbi:MAG: flagellar biosynthesis protein FlhB [Planctomycetes bacterium]|nr:flagellar biosynthesis protein FlhB [Planctomycetota bacterium]